MRVTQSRRPDRLVFRLKVQDSDMGRVIGKEGRIASALRNVLRAAATRYDTAAQLEIG